LAIALFIAGSTVGGTAASFDQLIFGRVMQGAGVGITQPLAMGTLFMIYPLLDSLRVSFYTPDDTGALSFVGLGNYETLFFDENWSKGFWNALSNNFILFAIHMLVQNPIGLLLAALLSLPTVRGRNIYRTAMFLPTMMSVVIIGFVWQLILNPLWGVAETLLDIIGMVDYFQ
ncbi:MAG: hypothetical protein HN380_34820, partial [Victivallales bacterium]|nr:hypothetical protein [Victivallales bacterium]